ncbi:unnamed protein product, partial [Adineta steineri]
MNDEYQANSQIFSSTNQMKITDDINSSQIQTKFNSIEPSSRPVTNDSSTTHHNTNSINTLTRTPSLILSLSRKPFSTSKLSEINSHLLSTNDEYALGIPSSINQLDNQTTEIPQITPSLISQRLKKHSTTQTYDKSSTILNLSTDEINTLHKLSKTINNIIQKETTHSNTTETIKMEDPLAIPSTEHYKISKRTKERYQRQRQIINIAKQALKPAFKQHHITKEQYKKIMKKVVTKATFSKKIDHKWINKSINAYMLLFIIFFIILISVILFKLHDRLTFQRGRLQRPYDRTSNKALTQMGTDQFIELSFGTVHYIYHPTSSSSSSLPLNVFVHGYSTPMEMWQDVFQALVKDNQPCLVYDLYGRGWSDSPHVPMNIDIFVCQLAELLYALNLPYKDYNLYGVSMGGAIIQRFTELYPSKVRKLILCCSAGLKLVKPSKILLFILSMPIIGPIAFKYSMQNTNEKRNRSEWAFPDSDKRQQYMKLFRSGWQQHPGYLRALLSTVTNFDFESSIKSIESI